MKLDVPSVNGDRLIRISEFTLDDFRTISFLIENKNDKSLSDFLMSKIETECHILDKFNILMQARIKFINESIILNNGTSNITINLNLWAEALKASIKDVKIQLSYEKFKINVDYPTSMLYDSYEDLIIDCIYEISHSDKSILFSGLGLDEKYKILEMLPPKLIRVIKDYIEQEMNYTICIMKGTLGLPHIEVNLFDDSIFSVIKTLYDYYNYDNIVETLYFLSKRITDITYLNSRTPRELELLIDLYSEEVEKSDHDTKSII
jgi:hypothetical protein